MYGGSRRGSQMYVAGRCCFFYGKVLCIIFFCFVLIMEGWALVFFLKGMWVGGEV